MTGTTRYHAIIPEHHESSHLTTQAAIDALWTAETRTGKDGIVEMRTAEGDCRGRMMVYPTTGRLYGYRI